MTSNWLSFTVSILLSLAVNASAVIAASSRLPTEVAGAEDSVTGLVVEADPCAALAWPSAAVLDRGLPAGAAFVAAQALLSEAIEEGSGVEGFVHATAEELLVGASVSRGREPALLDALAALARPRSPSDRAVRAAIALARDRAAARAHDPLEQARLAVLGQLLPGWRGPWLAEGTPVSTETISRADVDEVLRRVRAGRIAARAVGRRGLAAQIAERLGPRLGRLARPEAATEPASPQAGMLLYGPEGAQAGVVLAARFSSGGEEAPLLLEVLREGVGSLTQRLDVRLESEADVWLEAIWLAESGGVLLLGTRVDPQDAATAWQVLRGTVSSIKTQPFRRDAILRARQRLDARAQQRRTSSTKLLIERLSAREPWAWPPPNRWKNPSGSAELRAFAQSAFEADSERSAIYGARRGLRSERPFTGWDDLPLAGFCPSAVELRCPDGLAVALAAGGDAPGLATLVLAALGADAGPTARLSYDARYRVTEEAAGGSASFELSIEARSERSLVRWEGGGWSMEAHSAPEDDRLVVRGEEASDLPRPALDRVESIVTREPAVLASAVAAGLVGATTELVSCGGAEDCPAIRLRMSEGSEVLLVLDPESGTPLEARTWWSPSGDGGAPDEILRYERWRRVDGTRVAARYTVNAGGGPPMSHELISWSWRAPR